MSYFHLRDFLMLLDKLNYQLYQDFFIAFVFQNNLLDRALEFPPNLINEYLYLNSLIKMIQMELLLK